MQRYSRLWALWMALLLCVSCVSRNGASTGRDNARNPYGLDIVQTHPAYQRTIQSNPDNRLVNLVSVIPGIVLDIRYATTNNFTKKPVYKKAEAYLRRPAAEQLKEVQAALAESGLGLIVFDAYRPYSATLRFFEIVPDPNFCADPRQGSRHNRGCAVDVSLCDLKTRRPVSMPSDFDDFSDRAHPDYAGATPEETANRDRLIAVMRRHGFTVFPTEWWHFDFSGWERFPLTDLEFEALSE